MEPEAEGNEQTPRPPARDTARKTALHRMAITAATLAVLLFALWRCG